MAFDLPDLDWSTWLLIALGGFVFAALLPRLAPEGSRSAGKIMFIVICLAAICGFVGIVRWLNLQ